MATQKKQKAAKIRALSYSQINVFRTCRYWYWLKYIKRTPDIETSPLRKGKAIHKAIELYQRYLIKHGLMSSYSSDYEIMSVLQDALEKDRTGNGSIICDMHEDEIEDVWDVLKTFIENHIYTPQMKDIVPEFKLAFDADWKRCGWEDDAAYFRAIIDQIHKEGDLIVITDFKSNMSVPPPSIVDNNLQLEIYAYIMSLVYPEFSRFFIRLDFIRWNRQIERTIRSDEIQRVPDRIADYHKQIAEFDRWGRPETAMLGNHCNTMCPYVARCPKVKAVNDVTGYVLIEDDEQAREAAEKYIALKLAVSEYEKRIKAYIKRTEKKIPVNGAMLGWHEKSTNSVVDVQNIADELVKKGVPKKLVYDNLNLAYTKLGDIIKDHDGRLFNNYDRWRKDGWIAQTNSSKFELRKAHDEAERDA